MSAQIAYASKNNKFNFHENFISFHLLPYEEYTDVAVM
jgi:hypothetical protein